MMTKILIVDDKENNLLALENILKCLNVEVVKARSGQQALKASLNHEFALAILDVQMPVMDGYELADLLRSDEASRAMPVIFLSAVCSTPQHVFRGYSSGAVDFITKPFESEILLSKVRIFLELNYQKTKLVRQKSRLKMLVIRLKKQISARRQAEDSLRRNNEMLEQMVAARTMKLAEIVESLNIANEQLSARAGQLRALAGELTMAEYRQRQQVSRFLHDGLQQHLVIAKLRLGAMASGHDSGNLQLTAAAVEHLIGDAIKMTRSLNAELSPPVLYQGGLADGLSWLATWMADKHKFEVDLDIQTQPDLPKDVKILAFESVRELLFNAVKHAGICQARVCMQPIDKDRLCISVRDKGTGFDVSCLKPAGDPGAGFGLFSIRERISLIGGCLKIESTPGQGSCFTLTIPWIREPATGKYRVNLK